MSAPLAIADHGVIGNTRTAALVGRDGAVDWYCWPRFDSPSLFGRLLDEARGGGFEVRPTGAFTSEQAYLEGTNVLTTTFEAAGGRVRLTDFFPLGPGAMPSDWLVRCVDGLGGELELEVRLRPAFDYARDVPPVQLCPGGALAHGGGVSLALTAGHALAPAPDGGVVGRVRVRAGERVAWVLAAASTPWRAPPAVSHDALERALQATVSFWRGWVGTCTYEGAYRERVLRSALVLKLLTYGPTGAPVAAPTTSLPETPGGVRNWDYRFTWLRDAALTFSALMRLGHHHEAMAFWEWLARVAERDQEDLRILYTVDGARVEGEVELAHLAGYGGARPVRVGNGAAQQRQLDVYGEVLEAADFCQAHMRMRHPPAFWRMAARMADAAAAAWRLPDQGLWEMRGAPRHYLHSKLMCWVALERAARLARRSEGLLTQGRRWLREARAVRAAILAHGVDPARGVFTEAFGAPRLDASALLVPLVGLLPATDPRVRATVEAVQRELADGGLVLRHRGEDGLPGRDGRFLLCSFWLVDNLTLAGRVDEARALFERIAGHANALGLLSEEVDADSGALLGNFPQGFSHLGLIQSARLLDEADPASARVPAAAHAHVPS